MIFARDRKILYFVCLLRIIRDVIVLSFLLMKMYFGRAPLSFRCQEVVSEVEK